MKAARKIVYLILFVLIIIAFASKVLALGITPGRTTFEYEPGAEKEVEFTVINSEHKDMQIVVFVQGEFNQSVSLSEVSFKMKAKEDEKKIKYKFTIPQNLAPGQHLGEIVALQLPDKVKQSETFVGATVAVITQIYIFSPFPNKYAEASLNVVNQDGKIVFVIPVVNRGKLDLARVKANIDIYGNLNEKIISFFTDEIPIETGQRKEVTGEWAANVTPGTYRVVATLIYDENTLKLEKMFNVGVPTLELQNIEVNDFSLGEIAKFEMLVESKWSEPIPGAYAQMNVFNDKGEVMADFKSATYDFAPLTKQLVISFWDTKGVKKGTYDSSVFLRHGEYSSQKDFKLEVNEDSIKAIGLGYVISSRNKGASNVNYVLIAVIVVLVLINLLWFLILRKKLFAKTIVKK